MLAAAGHTRVRLVTNNPAKVAGLQAAGIDVVERVPAPTPVTEHNLGYLRTKRDRMAHALADRVLEHPAAPGHEDPRHETPTHQEDTP